MHFSLVLIGAHDGAKTDTFVKEYSKRGKVLLVEPVPWLYERLKRRFSGFDNIFIGNFAVSDVDGIAEFYAPLETANSVYPVADQLGSLNSEHAVAHCSDLRTVIQKISVQAKSFKNLIQEYQIESIELLFTDTEGYDAKILQSFPFFKIIPENIFFEHKHADGYMHIGKNFAALLVLLDVVGYKVRFYDIENCFAERK